MPNPWPLLVVALLLPSVPPAAPAEYKGCRVEAGLAICAWSFTSATGPSDLLDGNHTFELPVFDVTIATFRVSYHAAANAPSYGAGGWNADVSDRNASPDAPPMATFGSDSGPLLSPRLLKDGSYHAVFRTGPEGDYVLNVRGGDPGEYRVEYEGLLAPPGVAPERPAATFEEPHLQGAPSGSDPAGLDLLAAWMTDDRLGDGLFEAHIAVVDLADVTLDDADARFDPWVLWIYDFVLDGNPYRLWLEMASGKPEVRDCEIFLMRETIQGLSIATPWCEADVEGSVLTFHIPEAALGNPAAGARFTEMLARSAARSTSSGGIVAFVAGENDPQRVDRLDAQRFGFALGGPVVWDELNGCAFCVPAPAWAEAPLSDAHVGNTLQLLAILATLVAFLVGLLLVRRRRARVKRLFDEVDAVVRQHPTDTRAGLLALGVLESDFDARYRSGKLHENEYQLASQRIATAATRLSLRRDLGLDDGVPGDEPHSRGVRR